MTKGRTTVLEAAVALLLLAAGNVWVRGQEAASASFTLPAISGWALAPDGKTLIVATASAGELVYFDTAADKESKHVEVEFQPTCLAVQGDTLIAGAKGSAQLHLLDLATGKEKGQVELSGGPVESLACHPTKGYVFAANQEGTIFALDLATAKGWKTDGQGSVLAVDPSDGSSVYSVTQRAIRETVHVQQVGPQTQVRFTQSGRFATLAKFTVSGKDLVLAGTNTHAAINAHALAVTPDGTRVAVVGAGGIESPTTHRRSYDIPVYSTAKVEDMVGQVEVGAYPNNVAFHPVLNLGVAEKSGGELILFKSKSLVQVKTTKVGNGDPAPGPTLLTFGGQGKKILYGFGRGEPVPSRAKLVFLPLELSAEQQADLQKASAGTAGK